MPSSSFTTADPAGASAAGTTPYSVPSSSNASTESVDRTTMMYPPPVYGPYDGTGYGGSNGGMMYPYPPSGGPPPGYPPNYPPPYNSGGRSWSMYDNATYGSYPSQRPRDMNTADGTNENNQESKMDESQHSKDPEESMDEVAPIQTDFHFFVLQWKDKLLSEAEAEVDNSLKDYDDDYKAKHRPYLINSNLNCRLMKKWEDFTMEEREEFFQKEEDDRRRFMTEDEVISRHCFTLTARVRPPAKKNSEEDLGGEKRSQPESSPTTEDETPPKKNRVEN